MLIIFSIKDLTTDCTVWKIRRYEILLEGITRNLIATGSSADDAAEKQRHRRAESKCELSAVPDLQPAARHASRFTFCFSGTLEETSCLLLVQRIPWLVLRPHLHLTHWSRQLAARDIHSILSDPPFWLWVTAIAVNPSQTVTKLKAVKWKYFLNLISVLRVLTCAYFYCLRRLKSTGKVCVCVYLKKCERVTYLQIVNVLFLDQGSPKVQLVF